jgi:hypothetical protein
VWLWEARCSLRRASLFFHFSETLVGQCCIDWLVTGLLGSAECIIFLFHCLHQYMINYIRTAVFAYSTGILGLWGLAVWRAIAWAT